MNWLRIGLLNLILVWKDRQAVVWMVAMPMAFAYVFGLVFRPQQDPRVWIPVADYDGGRIAQVLIEQLKSPRFNVSVLDPERRGDFDSRPRTLVIPKGLTDRVLAGEDSKIYLVFRQGETNSSYSISAKVRLVEALGKLLPGMVRVQLRDKLASDVDAWEDLDEELAKDLLVKVDVRSASDVPVAPRGFAFTSVAMLVMFVLINTVIYGGNGLAEERVSGRLRRLAVSPASRTDILIGTVFGRWVLAILQSSALILVSSLLFHVYWGENPLGLALVIGTFAFSCASLGMVIGSVVSNPDHAIPIGIVGGNVLAGMGGCWWPTEIMPDWCRAITYFVPTGWAVHGVHEVVSWGRGTAAILPETSALLLLGLAALIFASRILRYE